MSPGTSSARRRSSQAGCGECGRGNLRREPYRLSGPGVAGTLHF
ncbi:Hypothetical protein AA314_00493 [Archangium gephyra]|uniref:Uncharacterized protein n=1 Tax=Archangium gephyra TaxID=48 RepID=A0AAC8Q148_9BACT|nr:Hypothetical protein AA314_00493 [Archangium gephyra]